MPDNPTTATEPEVPASKGLGGVIAATLGLAKSWIGQLTAYVGAVALAFVAFEKLPEPYKSAPLWLRIAILGSPLLLALVFQVIPEFIERRRMKRLTEVTGPLQPGYFQLAPREPGAPFIRTDGLHEEILRWIRQCSAPVLYLTGLSGSGKSSLLAAWVLPALISDDTIVIRLRGYQDPVAVLEQELSKPGVIWQKPATEAASVRALLERACRHIRPKRLLVVLDQFEEFVIMQDPDKQKRLDDLMSHLREDPIAGLTFLFVFRSDYIGLIEKLALPPLNQSTNWKEVPPFTESAARNFVQGSGLVVRDDVLREVLREAAEIEQTNGIIRPVTVNLCGLVLGRFTAGLPRGFRPGNLIRGFLRESILLPSIRDIAPVLIPHLITGYVTKRPRTIADLAAETAIDPTAVRGCLRVLGQSERAIVRPLDADQQTWEISHDFLVPLLDSIVARWQLSLWRRLRVWLPWLAATAMIAAVIVTANWRRDPILQLEDLGWNVHKTGNVWELEFSGPPPPQSIEIARHISQSFRVTLSNVDSVSGLSKWSPTKMASLNLSHSLVFDVSPLKDLRSLTSLDLTDTQVSDVSSLKDLHSLTSLDLSFTFVSDVSPLKDLHSLTLLDLNRTPVRDLSPLRGLHSLSSLNLDNTQVIDVSPLKDLHSLSSLNLANTHVSNVSPLKDLHSLASLDLTGTQVIDASPLKDLHGLIRLDLINAEVIDASSLKDLHSLNSLDLTGSKVSDVSPLKDLHSLNSLDLTDSQVSDVLPLKDLHNLTSLKLTGSKVIDVSPLKDLHSLNSLDLTDTQVSDISSLKDLHRLTSLNLSWTQVIDVSPLKDLHNLTSLDITGSKVMDVSPLQDLHKLKIIAIPFGIRPPDRASKAQKQ